MITGVQDIYYSTSNPQKAKAFYTEVLGMKIKFEHEGWIALQIGAVTVGLHPEDKPIPHVPRDSHGAHAGGTLTLKSDNIPEDRKRIEAFGCKVLGEADADWGHMLVFEDPDGNVLKLMKPKY
jgi:catechol 2,3-dioxygenase-like lactoylglutathione lyase family enzyme